MSIEPADHDHLFPPNATTGPGDEGEVRYRVLSVRTIWWAAALILLAGIGAAVWLLLAYGHGDTQQRNQLEAIKTAGTIVIGTGGAAALLLAARRQRSAEIALKQKDRDQADVARAFALQERVAAATETDAAERRITELYTKAADQLGSDKAPVRLAGLYALERLAQDNTRQRQPIVNLICAYLRMPYQAPGEPPTADAEEPLRTDYRERVQEREVRLTAQNVLTDHLRPSLNTAQPNDPFWTEQPDDDTFWPHISIDLTAATLINLRLNNCRLRNAILNRAQLTGDASFTRAEITEGATFTDAQFNGDASFHGGHFIGGTSFTGAQFNADATFTGTQFAGGTSFDEAQFNATASFTSTRFPGGASFDEAQFTAHASFWGAWVNGDASFTRAQFNADATFTGARFSGDTSFIEPRFNGDAWFDKTQFTAKVSFTGARFNGDASFTKARLPRGTSFRQAQFARGVPPEVTRFVSPSPSDTSTGAAGTAHQPSDP